MGIPALRALIARTKADSRQRTVGTDAGRQHSCPRQNRWRILVDDFAKAGRGVIMTMGKGGVGKTTIAAAIATELARRGCQVHLSTTDPAAHIAAAAGNARNAGQPD